MPASKPSTPPPLHHLAGIIAGAARLLTGVQVRWQSPQSGGVCVYFANHTSHLDALVLWAALPEDVRRRTRPVAARDYWEKTAMRRFLAERVFHAVLIARPERTRTLSLRATHAIIEQMSAVVATGSSLIVFPEGTRGAGRVIKPFKSGIFYLAKRHPELEFVPAYLENMNRILPKGEILPVPLLGRVTIGQALKLLPGENKRAFVERARQAVMALREARFA